MLYNWDMSYLVNVSQMVSAAFLQFGAKLQLTTNLSLIFAEQQT